MFNKNKTDNINTKKDASELSFFSERYGDLKLGHNSKSNVDVEVVSRKKIDTAIIRLVVFYRGARTT